MMWEIPKMWEGGECWIIGGGGSMPRQFGVPEEIIDGVYAKQLPMSVYSPYLSAIHNKHVIGVNMAFELGNWVDLCIFGDGGFYFKNREALLAFPRLRVSCNPNLVKKDAVGVKHVLRDGRKPDGISTRPNHLSWNRNTGGAAINLAVQMGVKKIYLLGFDMNLDEKQRQHWHSKYPTANRGGAVDPRRLPFKRHLASFPAIARDAKVLGIEIINVNPKSAIPQFPRVSLKDVL